MEREYLKKLRTEKGLTMQDMADAFGITRQYYNLIEAGESQKRMDITLCTKIGDLFGIPLTEVAAHEQAFREAVEAAQEAQT